MNRSAHARALVTATAAGAFASGAAWAGPERPAVAFHYGPRPPLEQLSIFDWVVVDPGAVSTSAELGRLKPARPIAYVSVGELADGARWADRIDAALVLGRNTAWGSRIMDIAHPGWQAFLLDRIMPSLWAAGFRGFFFDTLDSHALVVADPQERARRFRAVASFVLRAKARFPEAVLIANRGFEVLTEMAPALSAVAVESLFAGWDQKAQVYVDVYDTDRRWIEDRLQEAKALGLKTIAIDYRPPHDREGARAVAQRIAQAGHIPWVAPAELDALGVGMREILPRRVLLVFDSKVQPEVAFTSAHRFLALPLEYLGLNPVYVDLRNPLPPYRLAGSIAGIVTWLEGAYRDAPADYRNFLLRHKKDGVPLVIFGELDPSLHRALGLRTGPARPVRHVTLSKVSEMMGFEAPPRAVAYELQPLVGEGPEFQPWLELRTNDLRRQTVLRAPWGGLALHPHLMADDAAGSVRWILDPFRFLAESLALTPAPRVDPTTENGRRLLIAHIDGDGAPSRAELRNRPLALTVIRRWLEKVAFPHTVSIVEGEVSPRGRHPELSPELETEARRLFQLPFVEPASHGYVHPFRWREFEAGKPAHLDLGGPTPTIERELKGSLEYVSGLAGRKVEVFLWTGDALPGARSLAILAEEGIQQMNGGLTVANDSFPSVTHVSPHGRPVGDSFQVYAPVMNENVYTHEWTGPFWGFRRVIETFDRTGSPRRLKPLNIYYHFYSGTKKASLRALQDVYADALGRNPLPIFASTWIRKVHETRRTVVARDLDGRFIIDPIGAVRTLRVPPTFRTLDLRNSEGVLGERQTPVGRYLHLDGRRRVVVAFSRRLRSSGPSLVESSHRVQRARRTGPRLEITFMGPPPIESTIAAGTCSASSASRGKEGWRVTLRRKTRLVCQGSRQ